MRQLGLLILFLFCVGSAASEIVGEVFGRPVTAEEFYYYYKTAAIFTRTGRESRAKEDIRQEGWQNLIFRQEAAKLGITVSQEEIKKELGRLLSEKDVAQESEKYNSWVKEQFGEDAGVLERRIADLLVINKLIKEKTEPQVTVTEEEARQKFLNQYNSFESEYIRFETEEEAKDFAEKVKKNPGLWKDTYEAKKPLGQKGASWINIMSLEALIDLWKIPKDDAYGILSHKEGDFIAAKFFYGDAVFRLLQKKEADIKQYDDKKQQYYINMLTAGKRYKMAKDYFEDLFKRANYKDYVLEKKRAAKIQELQNKSLVALETNQGVILLKLFPENAPLACENFTALVEKGYYDDLIFHRVIKGFMIQGGDPKGTGEGGDSVWGGAFEDEVSDGLIFDRPWLLAMANSGPNTNKSQFFITTKETPWLNGRHTIFGEVMAGHEAVEKIENVPTGPSDRPKEEQKIVKAYIKKEEGKR